MHNLQEELWAAISNCETTIAPEVKEALREGQYDPNTGDFVKLMIVIDE